MAPFWDRRNLSIWLDTGKNVLFFLKHSGIVARTAAVVVSYCGLRLLTEIGPFWHFYTIFGFFLCNCHRVKLKKFADGGVRTVDIRLGRQLLCHLCHNIFSFAVATFPGLGFKAPKPERSFSAKWCAHLNAIRATRTHFNQNSRIFSR